MYGPADLVRGIPKYFYGLEYLGRWLFFMGFQKRQEEEQQPEQQQQQQQPVCQVFFNKITTLFHMNLDSLGFMKRIIQLMILSF